MTITTHEGKSRAVYICSRMLPREHKGKSGWVLSSIMAACMALLASASFAQGADYDSAISQARESLKGSDYDGAIAHANDALQARPGDKAAKDIMSRASVRKAMLGNTG